MSHRVLVLGATGFIGGHVARAALARGWQVRALRRRPDSVGALADEAGQIEWVQGALPFDRDQDDPVLRRAMGGCEMVFHAAAAYPYAAREIAPWLRGSVRQIRAVLAVAADEGVKRFVYTSTLTTIGPPGEPGRAADERDLYLPGTSGSAYYECKFAMEMEVFRAAAQGLPVVILNPTAVFGPGDVKPTTGEIILRAAKGQIPFYFDAVINAVDGRDVALAHVAAAEHGTPGQRYILGGHNLELRELLEAATRAAGIRPPRWKVQRAWVDVLVRAGAALKLPVPENVKTIRFWQPVDSSKAQHELGLCARPFEQTARDTIAWFRHNHYL